jgi:hypothetical protein
MLSFENGSLEPAYLPQPSVRLVSRETGVRITWRTFFFEVT